MSRKMRNTSRKGSVITKQRKNPEMQENCERTGLVFGVYVFRTLIANFLTSIISDRTEGRPAGKGKLHPEIASVCPPRRSLRLSSIIMLEKFFATIVRIA